MFSAVFFADCASAKSFVYKFSDQRRVVALYGAFSPCAFLAGVRWNRESWSPCNKDGALWDLDARCGKVCIVQSLFRMREAWLQRCMAQAYFAKPRSTNHTSGATNPAWWPLAGRQERAGLGASHSSAHKHRRQEHSAAGGPLTAARGKPHTCAAQDRRPRLHNAKQQQNKASPLVLKGHECAVAAQFLAERRGPISDEVEAAAVFISVWSTRSLCSSPSTCAAPASAKKTRLLAKALAAAYACRAGHRHT